MKPLMKMLLFVCRFGTVLAMLLLGGRASAQCGAGIVDEGEVKCTVNPTTYMESTSCSEAGNQGRPDDYCSEGYGYCSGTGIEYSEANLTYDPAECGDGGSCPCGTWPDGSCMDCDGGGGGGGGDCHPDCTYYRKAGLHRPGLGDYYRNGELFDELPFGFVHAKRTTGLADAPHAADALLNEPNNLGGGTMKLSALLLSGVCGVAPMLCAQQAAMPIVSLKATTKVELPLDYPTSMAGQAMSDGAGNVYTRQLSSEASKDKINWHRLPILKASPKGNLAGNFRVTDAFPDDADPMGRSFFVDHDGRVYQAVIAHHRTYVVEFAPDGSAKAKTKLGLDSYVDIWHLAVFKSGEYLLVGSIGSHRGTPFTAVFSRDGKLVKKIYEPEDEEARQKAGTTWNPGSNLGNGGTDFVSSGDLTIGSDGNAYLLHGTGSNALVYVVSPAGDVVRKLRIDARNPDLVARGIKSYAGRLAIGFDGSVDANTQLIKVTDLQGASIADYGISTIGDESLFLAGYDSEGFTFVPDFTKNKFYLLKAKLP
jgi:hypothetical protein